MNVSLLAPGERRWDEVLAQVPHDLYHTPAYLELSARYEGGEPVACLVEDGAGGLLLPLLLRPLPENLGQPGSWRDAASPYGYASPLCFGRAADHSARPYLEAFCAHADALELVSAFLRFHPLLPLPLQDFSRCGTLVRHGQTVAIDLTLDDAAAWSQMRENHRKGIQRLRQAGYRVEMDRWDDFERFVALYRDTMRRVGATPFYFFSDRYFDDLRQLRQGGVHLCSVLAPGGDLAAAGLFFTRGALVEFHLAGTAEEHVRQAPSKLMFDHVRSWGRTLGHASLHIGGGVGGESDSLFNFKVGFSKQVFDFHTFRAVFNESRYAAAAAAAGREQEAGERLGFFPCYRAGGPSAESGSTN